MSYTRYVAGGLVAIGIGHDIVDGVAQPDGNGDVPGPNRASVAYAMINTGSVEGPMAMFGRLYIVPPTPDVRWPNATMLSDN